MSVLVCLTRLENIVCDPELGNDFRDVSIFQPISSYYCEVNTHEDLGCNADSDNEQIFKLAGMIYPKAVGTMDFLGNKKGIQIPQISIHPLKLLRVLNKHH